MTTRPGPLSGHQSPEAQERQELVRQLEPPAPRPAPAPAPRPPSEVEHGETESAAMFTEANREGEQSDTNVLREAAGTGDASRHLDEASRDDDVQERTGAMFDEASEGQKAGQGNTAFDNALEEEESDLDDPEGENQQDGQQRQNDGKGLGDALGGLLKRREKPAEKPRDSDGDGQHDRDDPDDDNDGIPDDRDPTPKGEEQDGQQQQRGDGDFQRRNLDLSSEDNVVVTGRGAADLGASEYQQARARDQEQRELDRLEKRRQNQVLTGVVPVIPKQPSPNRRGRGGREMRATRRG